MTNVASASKQNLFSDQRGAIMMMGIAMAMFLTGITWYMVGVGHMLVAHDHFQEAADSAAFTSAVIHARGMNLIAALNLVMLALTAVYLILALIFAALLAATIAAALSILGIPATPGLFNATKTSYDVWTKYYKFYKPAIMGINYVQTGAAVIFPWAGQAASIDIGNRYGKASSDGANTTTFSASASMIPGPEALKFALKGDGSPAAAAGNVNAGGELSSNVPAGGGGAEQPEVTGGPGDMAVPDGGDGNTCGAEGKFTEKIALPVKAIHPSHLCTDLTAKLIDVLFSFLPVHIPDGGFDDAFFSAKGKVEDLLGGVVSATFCGGGASFFDEIFGTSLEESDSPIKGQIEDFLSSILGDFLPNMDFEFWAQKAGPKIVFEGGSNGSSWMQVYGFAVGTERDTKSGKLVSAAKGVNVRRDSGGYEPNQSFPMGYFAQAEFYFDCSEDWAACDSNHNAMYGMKWRARLRQVVVPAVIERTFSSIGQVVANADGALEWLRARIPSGENNVLADIQGFIQNFLDSDLAKFLKIDRDYVEGQIPDLGLLRVPDMSGFAGPTPIIH